VCIGRLRGRKKNERNEKKETAIVIQAKYQYKVISLFLVLYSRFLSPKPYPSSGGKVHVSVYSHTTYFIHHCAHIFVYT